MSGDGFAMATVTDRSDQSTSVSGDEVGFISKSAEGESGNANTSASAFKTANSESGNIQSVKSTKLLPALGNHDANTGEHKSGETLVLNRVESHETENTKEVLKESEMKVKEGTSNVSTGHHASSQITNKSADAQELNTGRIERVFSQADEWLGKSLPTVSLEKHINNGLDEMTLRENEKKPVNADSIDKQTEQPATTEGNLKDLEDIAVKLNSPTTSRAEDISSMLEGKSESGHNAVGLEESMGRSMDAAHSSENKLEVAFGEKAKGNEIPAAIKPMLGTKTNVEGGIKVSEENGSDVHSNEPKSDGEIIENPKIENLHPNEATGTETESLAGIIAQPAVTQVEAQTNLHVNNASSAEKRAKFFNDNSTSSQMKMNLPNGPEVWSLAGMRMVPKAPNVNGTPMLENKSADQPWQANEILTTERTINVSDYSEKILLDWTKVMGMRGELESEGTEEKNVLTGNALEDKVDSMKSPKTELPLQMTEIWERDGPSKKNATVENITTAHHTTEGFMVLNVGHELSDTQTRNDITHTVMKTTAMPAIITNPPTTQTILSSDSPLSVDNNDKRADFTTSVVTAGIGEPLNEFSAGVEKINATEASSTLRQTSEVLNFINTSTTSVTLLDVAAGTATAIPISNETTTTPASTTTIMLTALPVEQSTSTATMAMTTPPPNDISVAPTRWDNATALQAEPETTEDTLLRIVDADITSAKVDISSTDGMHNVTLEQQLKREPETVTETANTTEEQGTLLTLSKQPTTEASGLTSVGERKSYVNANTSAETSEVEGIATQNETPSVATVTTTESSLITETTTITLINTSVLSTDLVERNTNSKISEVLAVTTIATTTEVSQIGNEVELEVRTEGITDPTEGDTDGAATKLNNDTGSSTIEKLEETVTNYNEANAAAKPASSINEFLVPVNKTTVTSRTALPITTPPTHFTEEPVLYAATTLKIDANVNEETTTTIIPLEITTVQAIGSVLENNTPTTNTLTPVDLRNSTTVSGVPRDTESSIETNVIDQLEKTAVKITSTITFSPTTATNLEVDKVDGGEKSSTEASHIVSVFDVSNETTLPNVQDEEIITAISTTTTTSSTLMAAMATIAPNPDGTLTGVNNTSSVTTTTEPPLINLLDESTTAATTNPISMLNQSQTTTSIIAVHPQEVYTVFSTTEESTSTSTSTSTAAIAPQVPIITTTSSPSTPVDSSTYAYIPKVASTIATLTTTMLPPTLHAAIGGDSRGGAPSHMPGMINAGMRPNTSDVNETDVNVIIAITVSIIGVVALILLVAFLYLMRKRQKQMSYSQRCRPVSLDAYSLDNVSVLGSVRRKGALRASKRSYGNIAFDDPSLRHNALSASELVKFVERRSSIFEEFRDVPQIIARADEIPAGCEDKNR